MEILQVKSINHGYKLHITDNKMTIQVDENIANTYKTVRKRTASKLKQ